MEMNSPEHSSINQSFIDHEDTTRSQNNISQPKSPIEISVPLNSYITYSEMLQTEWDFDWWWRSWDLVTCFLTTLGFFTATVEYETTYSYSINAVQTRNVRTTSTIWGVLTTCITFLSIISIIFRHNLKRQFKKMNIDSNWKGNEIHHQKQDIFTKRVKPFYRKKTFYLELIITVIQPIPFYNYEFTLYFLGEQHMTNYECQFLLSEFLYALMILRIFHIIWNLLNWSSLTNYYS